MSLFVAVLGAVLLCVPVLLVRAELGHAARVRLACVAAFSGTGAVLIGALLAASPLLLLWHGGIEPARETVWHLSPGGPWAWGVGVALAAMVSWAALDGVRRAMVGRRRASVPRWAADSYAHDHAVGAEIRVAPVSTPVAFAVPGRDRHVVVSSAMFGLLDDHELRAVLAHEGAHLRLRHDRHLLVLAVYGRLWGWVPGVAMAVATHRGELEAWADVEAGRDPHVRIGALSRAREVIGPGRESHLVPRRSRVSSPLWRLLGVSIAVGSLVSVAGYAATHTLSDLSTAFAALH